ncbi:hypothetical protein ACFQS7_26570 [Dankookia sp. GCM10030260]|uniref:hypothetical protein n=1 Tax=Dankookia sp. GCM10030260 TaxID=3273390 RepID=UPI00360F7AA7
MRQKEKDLIKTLTRTGKSTVKGDKKLWDTVGLLWQTYALEVCGDGFSSLPTLDSAAAIEPDLNAARAHGKELIELLGPDRACGEIVERLFWASPFPTYPEWQSEIGALPSEAELTARLERERLLEHLSHHVDALAVTAKEHETSLLDLRQATATAGEQLQKLSADTAARAAQDTQWNGRLGELLEHFNSITAGVTSLGSMVEEVSAAARGTASALEELAEKVATNDASLSSITTRVDEVETLLLSSVDELRTELRSKAERQSSLAGEGAIVAEGWRNFLTGPDGGSPQSLELIDDPETLFSALINAFGARGADIEHVSRLDIAIRARELPVLIGPHAREVSEAWLLAAAAGDPEIVWTDPTLLSLSELVPSGPRGNRAPLSRAFVRALTQPGRCVVVFLDDFDPASAGFWLADLARAIKQPARYGFPENLVCVAIYEGEPAHIALPRQRAGDLFPLCIDKLAPPRLTKSLHQPTHRTAISRALVAPPRASGRWQDRVDAFRAIATSLIPDEKLDQWVDAFATYLRHMKDAVPFPANGGSLADALRAASTLISVEPKDKTNA